MGIPKCHLKPELVQKWLGFLVDYEHELFKVANTIEVSPKACSARWETHRSQSGCSPSCAFQPKNLSGNEREEKWDSIFPTPDSVKQVAEFWLRIWTDSTGGSGGKGQLKYMLNWTLWELDLGESYQRTESNQSRSTEPSRKPR
jgi:hypothetical protein